MKECLNCNQTVDSELERYTLLCEDCRRVSAIREADNRKNNSVPSVAIQKEYDVLRELERSGDLIKDSTEYNRMFTLRCYHGCQMFGDGDYLREL